MACERSFLWSRGLTVAVLETPGVEGDGRPRAAVQQGRDVLERADDGPLARAASELAGGQHLGQHGALRELAALLSQRVRVRPRDRTLRWLAEVEADGVG